MHIAAESVTLCVRMEILTAFLELERAACGCGEIVLTIERDFSKLGVAERI
jgi:hypothetical protein